MHIAAIDAAKIDDFYKTISSISFTLPGLWWIAVQLTPGGATVLRAGSAAVYALIALFALRPALAMELGLGLAPREVEAILVSLLIVVGVNLAWFGITEAGDTAGA